ncbi:hypothetical protein E4U59_005034 [Claviceps monticola]|nr:hypothetical protein E4U59_005034 [Claviceps monticola]
MPIHLLDLPVDVLALILKPFLVQRRTIPLCPCGSSFHSWSWLEVRSLPILLINSVIHRIATRLFYQSNTFMLDLEHDHGPHVEGCLPELAKGAHAADVLRVQNAPDGGAPIYRGKNILMIWPALSRIRCLEIRLEQLEPWIGRLVWPLIQDMIVRGDLTDLRVKVSACTDFISDSEDNSNPLDPSESLRDHFVSRELGPSQENGLKKWHPMSTKGEDAVKARNIIFTVSPLALLRALIRGFVTWGIFLDRVCQSCGLRRTNLIWVDTSSFFTPIDQIEKWLISQVLHVHTQIWTYRGSQHYYKGHIISLLKDVGTVYHTPPLMSSMRHSEYAERRTMVSSSDGHKGNVCADITQEVDDVPLCTSRPVGRT